MIHGFVTQRPDLNWVNSRRKIFLWGQLISQLFFFFPFFKVLLKYNWSTSASFFTSQLCNTFQPLIYRKEFLHNRPRTKTLWRSGDFCNFCLSVKLKVRLLHALLEYSIEGRAGKTAFHLGEEEVWGMAF